MSKTLLARLGSLSFAHLGGVSARAAAAASDDDAPPKDDKDKDAKGAKGSKAADDERKQRDDESDDEYAKRMKAMDDDEDTEAKSAKGSKAGKDDSGKGGDEDDDDSDEEMRGKSASAVARRRERARCASIFACDAAGANPSLAAHLAFNTTMTRSEAIGTLKATPPAAAPAQSRAAHSGRSAHNPNVSATAGSPKSRKQELTSMWDQAQEANSSAGRRPLADNLRNR